MNLFVSDFVENRIRKALENLLETDCEYALAAEKSEKLFRNIEPIIFRTENITISGGDCMDFKEFLEHQSTQFTIVKRELYKQGYLDCVKLLDGLGVL